MIEDMEAIAEKTRQLAAIKAVEIRRHPLGFRIDTQPSNSELARTVAGRGNQAFSDAVGHATHTAAELGVELVDKTGRLSAEDCAALVAAMADKIKGS